MSARLPPRLGILRRLTGPRLLKRHLLLPSRSPQPTRTAACLLPGLPLQQSRRQRGGDAQGRQDRGRPTLESAWGRQARGEFAAQVNRLARRRALPPPRPPSDFQARNSASRALSLARSLSRSLAASAAAAASLHTKDCYPLSSSSTSTSSSCDSSPDSRAGARRRRRREDLSLPATEAVSVAFFFLFYFALLLLLLLFCPYTSVNYSFYTKSSSYSFTYSKGCHGRL